MIHKDRSTDEHMLNNKSNIFRSMDSSFEMFNTTPYFPIYPYPLSEVSSLNSISFRNNNNITTNDYASYLS